MTEADWLACHDHSAMITFLKGQGVDSYRKYRLLLVAYCRTFLPELLVDEQTRHVIEVAEGYADESVDKTELARAKRLALKTVEKRLRLEFAVRSVTHGLPMREAIDFPYFCLRPWRGSNYNRPTPSQRRMLGQLIRDIFGNPFRPVGLDPAWLTWHDGLLVFMARQIYDSRDFADMPVLADALEEAGCTDSSILGHLRGPGPHVRGCWVIDLLIGKE